jgi:hypothetical protein
MWATQQKIASVIPHKKNQYISLYIISVVLSACGGRLSHPSVPSSSVFIHHLIRPDDGQFLKNNNIGNQVLKNQGIYV